MNNKGFTLTELLAIVAIIAIIGVIAVPSMSRQIKQEENANQRLLNNKIENAAHLYAAKYYADDIVNCTSNPCVKFALDDLQKDGLLSLKPTECSSKLGEEIHINKTTKIVYSYSNIKGTDCYQ